MSVCIHDLNCSGEGAAHDAATLDIERLLNLRTLSKPLIRSGNPFRRATGLALRARVEAAMKKLPAKEAYPEAGTRENIEDA